MDGASLRRWACRSRSGSNSPTRWRPAAEPATAENGANRPTGKFVETSHTFAKLSAPPVASWSPFALKAIASTCPLCPCSPPNARSSAPEARSKIRALRSKHAVATSVPSGLIATASTESPWPFKTAIASGCARIPPAMRKRPAARNKKPVVRRRGMEQSREIGTLGAMNNIRDCRRYRNSRRAGWSSSVARAGAEINGEPIDD